MRVVGATMDDFWHWVAHILAPGAILAALVGYLPAVAALAAGIWYAIQIYESDTCQRWLDKRRTQRKLKRIAKLSTEHKMLIAELDALAMVREARVVAADKVASAAAEARRQLAVDNNTKIVKAAVDDVIKSTPVD